MHFFEKDVIKDKEIELKRKISSLNERDDKFKEMLKKRIEQVSEFKKENDTLKGDH